MNLIQKLGIVIIATGLALGSYAYVRERKADIVIEDIIIMAENKIENIPQRKKQVETFDKTNHIGLTEDDVLGIVTIPALDVKAPLTFGEDEEYLKYGVGLSHGTPGQKGNSVIGGHRNFIHARHFKFLHKLNKDDIFYIHTQDGKFKYKIVDVREVQPEDTWILRNRGGSTATLLTCTVDSKRRVVVFGELID